MTQSITLINAIKEEDELLRLLVVRIPRGDREVRGEASELNFKDTLGHIAFWDDFTVQFFRAKLDRTRCALSAPVDFEERSRQELEYLRPLPFGEVLARYLESTGRLVDFLREHWGGLTAEEQHEFWVPLQHRRQHRLALYALFALDPSGNFRRGNPDDKGNSDEMAAEA